MTPKALVARLARMDARELHFRVLTGARSVADRVEYRLRRPRWRRTALSSIVTPSGAIAGAARAAASGDVDRAEEALRAHFMNRRSVWPAGAARRSEITALIKERFPSASEDARRRADRMVTGEYDLLGYRALPCGRVPSWNEDVVHGRRAANAFCADVAYLDPSNGDHKIIWELNRHQHWLALGRGYWLTGRRDYAITVIEQLHAWLDANPPLHGINWASMLELAFRCLSWTRALEFFADTRGDGGPWLCDLLVGVDRQLRHIERNLSRYFSPNTHLSGEALALYVVSQSLPELAASSRRAAIGRKILLEERHKQVRRDGGHAELSTHYHRYSTDFYLLATVIARESGDAAADAFAETARAHAHYLRTVADEAGGLQMIGDDDGGQLFAMCGTAPADVRTTLSLAAELLDEPSLAVSPMTEEACWMLGRGPRVREAAGTPPSVIPVRWPSRLLADSGYFVSRGPGELAIFDAGPHGYLNAGHAHADALAVVTTVGRTPLLTDPGTGTYTMDPELRDRLRSSRMHNTVVVDGREPSVPSGPFHWSSMSDARVAAAAMTSACDIAQGIHDGYGTVRHVRTFVSLHRIGWLIIDHLLGDGTHEADLYWHLHPSWLIASSDAGAVLRGREGQTVAFATSASSLTAGHDGPLAIHAPEYGRLERAPVLHARTRGTLPLAIATFISTGALPIGRVAMSLKRTAPGVDGWEGTAVDVESDGVHISVLAAAPTGGQRWPRQPWGTQTLSTDGRIAADWCAAGHDGRAVVDGSRVTGARHLAPALHVGRA